MISIQLPDDLPNESFHKMTNENFKFLYEFSQSEDSISYVRKLEIEKKRDF